MILYNVFIVIILDSEMWEVCWQLRACLPREQHDLDEFKRIVQAMLVCTTVGGFTHLAGRLVGGVLGGRLGKVSSMPLSRLNVER